MKKYNKLFAILFAVLGVTTLKAQTDVTDQYLVNADFEGSYESVYEIKNDGRCGCICVFSSIDAPYRLAFRSYDSRIFRKL